MQWAENIEKTFAPNGKKIVSLTPNLRSKKMGIAHRRGMWYDTDEYAPARPGALGGKLL